MGGLNAMGKEVCSGLLGEVRQNLEVSSSGSREKATQIRHTGKESNENLLTMTIGLATGS